MAEEEVIRPSFVQLFPSDWKAGTAIMTPLEEWTYHQVCLHNWDKGEAMPKRLQPGLLGRNPEWQEAVDALLEMGKMNRTQGGGLLVQRAMRAYHTAAEAVAKKAKAGSKGGKTRWNNNAQDSGATDDGRNGDLVFSVPVDLWRDYREHRRKLGAPMTPRAERGIMKRLEEIRDQHGHDPEAVLEQSIRKGWRDVFPLKGDSNGNRAGHSRDGFFDALRSGDGPDGPGDR